MNNFPYKHVRTNPIPKSIFEDWASKLSKLTKSPQTSHYGREHRLPPKAQMSVKCLEILPLGVEPKS